MQSQSCNQGGKHLSAYFWSADCAVGWGEGWRLVGRFDGTRGSPEGKSLGGAYFFSFGRKGDCMFDVVVCIYANNIVHVLLC